MEMTVNELVGCLCVCGGIVFLFSEQYNLAFMEFIIAKLCWIHADVLRNRRNDWMESLNGILVGREFRRLSFLVERDGIVKAKEFAKRGIKQYRKYILSKQGYPFNGNCMVKKVS